MVGQGDSRLNKWRHQYRRETSVTILTSFTSHLLTHLVSLFHLLCGTQDWCGGTYLPTQSHSSPHGHSSSILPPLPLPLFLSSFTPRKSTHFSSRWPSSTFSACLYGRKFSHTLAPSKTHVQYMAVGFTMVGFSFYAWCATSGATAAVPGSIPQQTICGWPRGAAPHAPLWSHLQHLPGNLSPPTWSEHVWPSRPGNPSTSDFAHQPRRVPSLQDLPLKEAGFCSSIATASKHCHAELQDFHYRHQVLVACVQETKLVVNSSFKVKEFTGFAIIRHDRPAGGDELVTLVHHSVPYRVPDCDIHPDDDTDELLAVENDLWGTTLTSVNVYITPSSSCPRNYTPDFDTLHEDLGDHPSWFSRTGDDRASARGEALYGAINCSQLAVVNQDLPSQG